MGTILNDATINFRMGGDWDGTTPTFTGSTPGGSFMARVRTFRAEDTIQKTDTKGAGMARAKNRFHTGEGTVTMSGVVMAAGFAFKDQGTVSPIGKWIEVTTVPNSAFETPDVYQGVITRWELNSQMGDTTIETIEFNTDADIDEVA